MYFLTGALYQLEPRFGLAVDVTQGRLPEMRLSSLKFVCNKVMPTGIKMYSMLWHVS